MAKGFWDDLGNTLTRKAKGFSTKAENLYEIQKIRNKLSAQERMTEKLMLDIGKMIYTRYEHGEAVDGELGAICEEISQHMLEADHYRDAIAASKGEKFCPACHKAVMREASFCPYCGAACPTPEIEEKAADVIEQADEELKDAAEAEVAEDTDTAANEEAPAAEAETVEVESETAEEEGQVEDFAEQDDAESKESVSAEEEAGEPDAAADAEPVDAEAVSGEKTE